MTITDCSTGDSVLLIQPDFPWPSKSKNSHQSIPYGLLRIANWMKSEGIDVRFNRGCKKLENYSPNEIWITSLFSYWAPYVEKTFDYYSKEFSKSRIIVGGILPSLSKNYCIERFGSDNIYEGLLPQAEVFDADYSLLEHELDFQVLISTRGCIRKCTFCYAWKLEGYIRHYPIECLTGIYFGSRTPEYVKNRIFIYSIFM